jgi:hypothetical protein
LFNRWDSGILTAGCVTSWIHAAGLSWGNWLWLVHGRQWGRQVSGCHSWKPLMLMAWASMMMPLEMDGEELAKQIQS